MDFYGIKFDSMTEFLVSAFIVSVMLSIVVMFIKIHFMKKTAQRIIDKQDDPVSEELYQGMIKMAREDGNEERFLEICRLIREKYGHKGLKVGHIVWALQQIDKDVDINSIKDIPPFNQEKTTSEF